MTTSRLLSARAQGPDPVSMSVHWLRLASASRGEWAGLCKKFWQSQQLKTTPVSMKHRAVCVRLCVCVLYMCVHVLCRCVVDQSACCMCACVMCEHRYMHMCVARACPHVCTCIVYFCARTCVLYIMDVYECMCVYHACVWVDVCRCGCVVCRCVYVYIVYLVCALVFVCVCMCMGGCLCLVY